MLTLIATNLIAVVPFEFVVDCSGWTGNGMATVTYRYEMWDGTVRTSEVIFDPRSTPAAGVTAFVGPLKFRGWNYAKLGKPGDEAMFVVRGSKTSLIKDVTFKGDIWAPVVTRRIATTPMPVPKK